MIGQSIFTAAEDIPSATAPTLSSTRTKHHIMIFGNLRGMDYTTFPIWRGASGRVNKPTGEHIGGYMRGCTQASHGAMRETNT